MTRLCAALLVLVSLVAHAGPPRKVTPEQLKMVDGSADYTRTLKVVLEYAGDRAALTKAIQKLALPPHPQGDAYVIAPVPVPPPGVKYEPALMPPDWVGTWGEVAMTFWRGDLSRDDYEAIHKALHGKKPGFPNCKR